MSLDLVLGKAGGLAGQSSSLSVLLLIHSFPPEEGGSSAFSLSGKPRCVLPLLGRILGVGSVLPCELGSCAGSLLWLVFMNLGDQSLWGAFLSLAVLSPHLESLMR